MHNASKVLLGGTTSSVKDVTAHAADPATFEAGLAVRLKNDGGLALTKASGRLVGISLGKSLSDTKKTAVARSGLGVPVQLTDDLNAFAYVVKGAKAYTDDTTGKASTGAGTTITDAVYVSGVLDGQKEDGTIVKVALIDFPGGL